MKDEIQKKALVPSEVDKVYSIPAGTQANMRSEGRGPRFYRVGRKIYYFADDVEKWLRSNPVETVDSVE